MRRPGCLYRGRFLTIYRLWQELSIPRTTLHRWWLRGVLCEALIDEYLQQRAELANGTRAGSRVRLRHSWSDDFAAA
jgi:hypothetical protein